MEQNKFIEDLLWCPSQIYYFTSNDRKFCIYLRWRWRDPWRAYLVECKNDWDFFDLEDWIQLSLSKDFKEEEYKELEEEALSKVASMFPNINFSEKSEDITLQLTEDDLNDLNTSIP